MESSFKKVINLPWDFKFEFVFEVDNSVKNYKEEYWMDFIWSVQPDSRYPYWIPGFKERFMYAWCGQINSIIKF